MEEDKGRSLGDAEKEGGTTCMSQPLDELVSQDH